MALLELKACRHCGKGTWHEFVPSIEPESSHWRCRDCGDRRESRRLTLAPDALLHHARLRAGTACTDVLLMDLSPSGARLRFLDEAKLPVIPGENILLNPQLQPFGELAVYQPALVRWVRGQEFGVFFAKPLPIASTDILRIVKN